MTIDVGAIALPLTAGLTNERLVDPAVEGILRYLAFCIKADANAKLANMAGMSPSAIAATYPYDPNSVFVRNTFPALYLWWGGIAKPSAVYSTLAIDVQERQLLGLYLFDETTIPAGALARSGLLASVQASIANAMRQRCRATYTPIGGTVGQDVREPLNLVDWAYTGSTRGEMVAAIPSTSPQAGGPPEGHVKAGYPALSFGITIFEQVGAYEGNSLTPIEPGAVTINANDGLATVGDVIDNFMQRTL